MSGWSVYLGEKSLSKERQESIRNTLADKKGYDDYLTSSYTNAEQKERIVLLRQKLIEFLNA